MADAGERQCTNALGVSDAVAFQLNDCSLCVTPGSKRMKDPLGVEAPFASAGFYQMLNWLSPNSDLFPLSCCLAELAGVAKIGEGVQPHDHWKGNIRDFRL
jgi:hypothetical protein